MSWSRGRADLSSARPNHSCGSQLHKFSKRNRAGNNNCNHLNPSLLDSHRLLAHRVLLLRVPSLSCPISLGTFMTRVPPPHLLPKSSSRNNHAMPLHLAVHLPNVLVQHRPQVVQDLQRPLRVTDDRQPRPRRAIPCCAMERRSSTQKRTYVRNVRFLIHLSLPLTHAYP